MLRDCHPCSYSQPVYLPHDYLSSLVSEKNPPKEGCLLNHNWLAWPRPSTLSPSPAGPTWQRPHMLVSQCASVIMSSQHYPLVLKLNSVLKSMKWNIFRYYPDCCCSQGEKLHQGSVELCPIKLVTFSFPKIYKTWDNETFCLNLLWNYEYFQRNRSQHE